MIPAARLFDCGAWKRNYFRKAVYVLFAVSAVIQIAAVSVDCEKYLLSLRYEENMEFTRAEGVGVPPIVEPPAALHFDWRSSHITAQLRFIYEIARGMRDYRYAELPEYAPIKERLKADPLYNLFDFWWVYRYYLNGGDHSGFLAASVLFIAALFAASRLRKVTGNEAVLKHKSEDEDCKPPRDI
jgi:hypothetical protein